MFMDPNCALIITKKILTHERKAKDLVFFGLSVILIVIN